MKPYIDFDDGDIGFPISDKYAVDSDGYMMMRLNDNMALEMDSFEIHFISSWPQENDN